MAQKYTDEDHMASQPDQINSAHVQVGIEPYSTFSSHTVSMEAKDQGFEAIPPAAVHDSSIGSGPNTYFSGYVYATIFNTAMGSLLFGYALSSFNPIRDFCRSYAYTEPMSEIAINFATSFVPLGAGIGSIAGGKIQSMIGRRKAMYFVDIISVVATMLTLLPNQVPLVIGRFILGWCAGVNSSIIPVYINEVAPNEIKGRLGTYHQLLVTCGFLLAPVLGLGVPGDGSTDPHNQFWRVVLALVAVPPVVRIILSLLFFREDSPKFLVATKREDEAFELLKKIYRSPRAEAEFRILKHQVDLESRSGKVTLKEIISPLYRYRLFIGIMVAAFSQLTGANGLTFFSNDIFKIGVDPNSRTPTIYTVIMNVIQVIATFIASLIIEKSGRKFLLVFGMAWLTVVLMAFSIVGTVSSESPALKWFIWAFMIGFGLSMGPLPWVYLADLLPDVGLGIAGCSNWLTTFLVGIAFPHIADTIGTAHAFFIFAGCTLFGTLFFLVNCHETKGKTQSEIAEIFNKKKSREESADAHLLN